MATFAGGQTYDPGSAGKVKLPNVPPFFEAKPQEINYPDWSRWAEGNAPDPYDYLRIQGKLQQQGMAAYPGIMQMQMGMMPQVTQAYMNASQQAFPMQLAQQTMAARDAFAEQVRQYGTGLPQMGLIQASTTEQMAPWYADIMLREGAKTASQMQGMTEQYAPEFMSTYRALGGRIGEGLEAGYELGSDLEREVQQGIRAGQAARGNYLGPAPTAAEAFGKGQAALNLYNTRLGQAQGYLQGKQPSDLWASLNPAYGNVGPASISAAMGGQPGWGLISPMAQPTSGAAPGIAASMLQAPSIDYPGQAQGVYGTYMGALGQYGQTSVQGQLGYNQNLIQAADVNNTGQYNMYDKQFEQFLFDQGVSQGLYSQPGSAGGMGGMGSMIGSGLGALGSIGGGLASAGVFGGTAAGAAGAAAAGGAAAAAGGATLAGTGIATAAAAAGSAAAICWLARAVLPDRWKEVREWLFTKAPDWFRRAYIYNARRFVARGLTKADKERIAEVLGKCLQ